MILSEVESGGQIFIHTCLHAVLALHQYNCMLLTSKDDNACKSQYHDIRNIIILYTYIRSYIHPYTINMNFCINYSCNINISVAMWLISIFNC